MSHLKCIDRSRFLKKVKQYFPDLTSQLNAQQGLLHLEMEVIHRYAIVMIKNNDHENLSRCFSLMNSAYINGQAKLKNAIDVSFVEGLPFKKAVWAWKLLPAHLQKLYMDFHGKLI